MDYTYYKRMYTGQGVKIALIDSGILEELEEINNSKIKRKVKKTIRDMHGTFCAIQIFRNAKNAEVYDLNVVNQNNEICESDLIAAIQFAVAQKVDIINISLKLKKFSEDLYKACQIAVQNGIIILAASDNDLSFPADFKQVIKITAQNQDVDILSVDNNCISIKNFDFKCTINKEEYTLEPSSSIACAHYAGILACIKESQPIDSWEMLKYNIFDEMNNDSYLPKIVELQNSTIVINNSDHTQLLSRFHKNINRNIIGYYDIIEKKFFDFQGGQLHQKDFKNILEICPLEYERQSLLDQSIFNNLNQYMCGCLQSDKSINKIELISHNSNKAKYISYVKTPVIFIAGVGVSSQKFEIQLTLFNEFKERDINSKNITYNPLGILYDFYTYEYPKEIVVPNIVFSINNDLYELSKMSDTDIIIANIAGGFTPLNAHNLNDFGSLFYSYIKAVDIDVLILTINSGINYSSIKKELDKIKLENIPNIFLVLTDLCYDEMLMESAKGVRAIAIDSESQHNAYKLAQNALNDYHIITMEDVRKGKLSDSILKLYS